MVRGKFSSLEYNFDCIPTLLGKHLHISCPHKMPFRKDYRWAALISPTVHRRPIDYTWVQSQVPETFDITDRITAARV